MNFASDLHSPIFRTVGAIADARGQRAFAIGGFTRDLLLRRSCKDIDIVTEGTVDEKILKALREKINIASEVLAEGYKDWLI